MSRAELREALPHGESAQGLRGARAGQQDRFQAGGAAGGSAQPSKELKGGDVGCHASLGRLCAANKKGVSACQSVTASGPSVQLSSLSSPYSPWFLSLPVSPSPSQGAGSFMLIPGSSLLGSCLDQVGKQVSQLSWASGERWTLSLSLSFHAPSTVRGAGPRGP